jgi:sugar lactone lactonase YvrE
MRRTFLTLSSLLFLAVALAVPVFPAAAAQASSFPKIIELPNGWQPEGVASGRGTTFYVGSLADGAIYRGDLRTGQGAVFVNGQVGSAATGMYLDQRSNYLFVSGGPTGQGRVYDATTGTLLETYQFQTTTTFINDVIVTREAAYFTDSFRPLLYRVTLGAGGALTDGPYTEIPLTGDFVLAAGFNANGIEATPDGEWLVIVQTATGKLFRVDPNSGEAKLIDAGGAVFANGDGLRFAGQYLYVVRNADNRIAEVRLNADLTAGTVNRYITDPALRVPTTIASFGDALYAANARFDTPPAPSTEYEVVRVLRR